MTNPVSIGTRTCRRSRLPRPGRLRSNEVTTYFPEDGVKIHLPVSGIDDRPFDEIQGLRRAVYELGEYLGAGRTVPVDSGLRRQCLGRHGGGTGAYLLALGDTIRRLGAVYLVDLSDSLLDVARRRADRQGWTNMRAVVADATTFAPDEDRVDVVTFSYSLTMIPDWLAALE